MKLLYAILISFAVGAYGQTSGGGGVISINAAQGPFTFTGGGVSCSGTTCTFSGGGGGSFTALTGDATSTSTGGATTVIGINNTLLSGLGSGPYYFTSGVPSLETSSQAIAALGATPAINCTSCTNIPAAAAGTLTGTTLASNVVSSSLTSAAGGSFGTAAFVATGTSGATIPLLNGANTYSGASIFSAAGAASTPGLSVTGNAYTGGSTTTNFPQLYLNCSGSTGPSSFLSGGTFFGINSCTGFAGNFLDFHANGGASLFSVNVAGGVTSNGTVAAQKFEVPNTVGYSISSSSGSTGTVDSIIGCRLGAAGVMGPESAATCTNTVAGATGTWVAKAYQTNTQCTSSASPAVCGSAAAGYVNVSTSGATVVVDTTAVTANSTISLTFDSSLGTALGVTCNTSLLQPSVSARTAGTSFTITLSGTPSTNPACISYSIVN